MNIDMDFLSEYLLIKKIINIKDLATDITPNLAS